MRVRAELPVIGFAVVAAYVRLRVAPTLQVWAAPTISPELILKSEVDVSVMVMPAEPSVRFAPVVAPMVMSVALALVVEIRMPDHDRFAPTTEERLVVGALSQTARSPDPGTTPPDQAVVALSVLVLFAREISAAWTEPAKAKQARRIIFLGLFA